MSLCCFILLVFELYVKGIRIYYSITWYFHSHCGFEIHLCCCIYPQFVFHCCIILHFKNTFQLIILFYSTVIGHLD